MNIGLDGRYVTRDVSFIYRDICARSQRRVAPRPFQIAACHISPAGTHVSTFTYVRAITRSECNATSRDPLAGLARSRETPAAHSLQMQSSAAEPHLSVIRMPIARLENDYGHERRLSR